MYSFYNDYSEGAHPDILKALFEQENLKQEEGYGQDSYCQEAMSLIRKKLIVPRLIYILYPVEPKQI